MKYDKESTTDGTTLKKTTNIANLQNDVTFHEKKTLNFSCCSHHVNYLNLEDRPQSQFGPNDDGQNLYPEIFHICGGHANSGDISDHSTLSKLNNSTQSKCSESSQ